MERDRGAGSPAGGDCRLELFGLAVASEVPFPEGTAPDPRPAEVTIRRGDAPAALADATGRGLLFEASRRQLLLTVDRLTRFLIADGRKIVVDAPSGAAAARLRLLLLAPVAGALLHQRGLLPIHASAVEVAGGAVLFTGPSGSGKSTIAGALRQRGYRVLADDLTAVATAADGTAVALPGYPQLALWKDSLLKIHRDPADHRRVRPELDKYALPLGGGFCPDSRPVTRIYQLMPGSVAEVDVVRRRGADTARALLGSTYQRSLVAALGIAVEHFRRCAAAAEQLSAAIVRRPRRGFELDRLVDAVEGDWAR